jgi:glyoxylase-like metal-dependent hydrolase (beta-lactamase superfamily II)
MRNVRFGDFAISKIADMEQVLYPPQRMYPDATPEALRKLRDLLGPQLIDGELNMLLSFNCFVIKTGRNTIVVDSCIGADKERPTRPNWHRRTGPFLDDLQSLGVAPEKVDYVLCTHLHADHVGWNTRLVNGQWVPTFSNAQYVMAEVEYKYWKAQHDQNPPEPVLHGSFADSVLPVVAKGQAKMVPMNCEVVSGVHLEGAPGHTPGAVVINVESGGARASVCGDMLHHPVQVIHPEWSTNFCEDPEQSRRTRQDYVRRHADTGTRILTGHFPTPTSGQIRRDGAGYKFVFD